MAALRLIVGRTPCRYGFWYAGEYGFVTAEELVVDLGCEAAAAMFAPPSWALATRVDKTNHTI
jgi:hypothetical protein